MYVMGLYIRIYIYICYALVVYVTGLYVDLLYVGSLYMRRAYIYMCICYALVVYVTGLPYSGLISGGAKFRDFRDCSLSHERNLAPMKGRDKFMNK